MESVGRLVFVTFELFPFTAGGIGRAVYNILQSLSLDERRRVSVVLVGTSPTAQKLPPELTGIDIIFADVSDERGLTFGEATLPPRWAYRHTDWHWRSFVALRALLHLNARREIDYVEFPDWGGLAFCAIQHKLARLAFAKTKIAVRLHGSHGVLLGAERYAVSQHDLSIFDLERKSLADCDLVVAQTRPYFDLTGRVFGIGGEEWEDKYFLSAPPVLIDTAPDRRAQDGALRQTILFTSKFQHIKRPELFVRGVAKFLAQQKPVETPWTAMFCARRSDERAHARVAAAIPKKIAKLFKFAPRLQGQPRDQLIAESVVVVTSACESFCLAAFEASLLGAIVVLNAKNPSFGADTLWTDGINCIKFDGTADGLCSALQRVTKLKTPISMVRMPTFAKPWNAATKLNNAAPHLTATISVLLYGTGDANAILRTLESVGGSATMVEELVISPQLPFRDESAGRLFQSLYDDRNSSIKIVDNSTDFSIGASLNRGLNACTGSLVLIVRIGDMFHERFIDRAATSLSCNPGFDAVCSQVGHYSAAAVRAPMLGLADSFYQYTITTGESKLRSLTTNCLPKGPVMFRRSIFDTLRFDEDLEKQVLWQLLGQMSSSDRRTIVLNGVYSYCHEINLADLDSALDPLDAVLEHSEMMQCRSLNLLGGSIFLLPCEAKRDELLKRTSLPAPTETWSETGQTDLSLDRDETDEGEAAIRALHQFLDTQELESMHDHREPEDRSQISAEVNDYELLNRKPGFDSRWYLKVYKDVADAGVDPLDHYLTYGASEGRDPNRFFSSAAYLNVNPDVKLANMNPLVHYIKYGRDEGRRVR